MTDIGVGIPGLAVSFVAGLLLGAVYCAMLWVAVRQLTTAQHPVLWLLGTALPRIAVPLAGFYWIMDGSWERLLACLAGFVVARFAIQHLVGSSRAGRSATP